MSPTAEGDTATTGERQRFEEAGGTLLDLKLEETEEGPWAKRCRGPQKVAKERSDTFLPRAPGRNQDP